MKIFVLLVLIAMAVNCEEDPEADADATMVLTDANFKEVLKNENASFFVMFFAPWCGHCTRLKPTWKNLAEMLNTDESRVKIAKVDCTENQQTCSENSVTSYPTLKFFKQNSEEEPIKYRSARDLPSLTNFINEQLGNSSPEEEETTEDVVVPAPLKGLIELTDKNFASQTANGNWFVKFYAPWCGHCQKLAPTFEDLAKSLEHDTTVHIAKLDCTEYRPICKDFEVKGYPTLLWLENGKKIDKYSGPRSLDDLKAYIEQRNPADAAPAKEEKKEGEGVAVLQLTNDNFSINIKTGVTFVKFFAPWCGHCKRLHPIWQQLAEKFVDSSIKIAKVDCTLQENRDLCSEQEVNGFPTLFVYKNGEKISEYNGSRSLEDLFEFVKNHASDEGRNDEKDEL